MSEMFPRSLAKVVARRLTPRETPSLLLAEATDEDLRGQNGRQLPVPDSLSLIVCFCALRMHAAMFGDGRGPTAVGDERTPGGKSTRSKSPPPPLLAPARPWSFVREREVDACFCARACHGFNLDCVCARKIWPSCVFLVARRVLRHAGLFQLCDGKSCQDSLDRPASPNVGAWVLLGRGPARTTFGGVIPLLSSRGLGSTGRSLVWKDCSCLMT
jgi:hypothetical protein